jgi:hypothetical protein
MFFKSNGHVFDFFFKLIGVDLGLIGVDLGLIGVDGVDLGC